VRITIHRGAHQIGGNCVEVATDSTRIILDVGLPLPPLDETPRKRGEREIDPVIKAVFDKSPRVDAIFVSHAHQDHTGLLNQTPKEVPIYLGEGTGKMMMVAGLYAGQDKLPQQRGHPLPDGEPVVIGDITVTAYPVDHSVFGAQALLVEADGKRVLYSGDLRLHGRKPGMAPALIKAVHAKGDVDVLLMEGTHVGASRELRLDEDDLKDKILADILPAPGLVLAMFSPMHLDRLVTFYKAARSAKRILVLDHYAGYVLHLVKKLARVPLPTRANGMAVFRPKFQRHYKKTAWRFRGNEITLDEILSHPRDYVMLFRPTMLGSDFTGKLPTGVRCIYSYWTGYLANADFLAVRAEVDEAGGKLLEHHTSGHIFAEDIVWFVEAIKPRHVIPIHTSNPNTFSDRFPNALLLQDAQPWDIC